MTLVPDSLLGLVRGGVPRGDQSLSKPSGPPQPDHYILQLLHQLLASFFGR